MSFGQEQTLLDVLDKFNSETIPYISVKDFKKEQNDFIILDAREKREYEVSHIKNAIFVGYNNFNIKDLLKIEKSKKIIVYCTAGVRAEDIAEKIVKNRICKSI